MALDSGAASTARGDGDRVVKKRASQACTHCRTRKVKCDLVKSGPPCHNCQSDGIDCVLVESRRSRKYRLQKRQLGGLVSLPPLVQAQPKSSSASPGAALGNRPPSTVASGDAVPGLAVPSGLSSDTPTTLSTASASASSQLQSPPAITPVPSLQSAQSHGHSSTAPSAVPRVQPPAFHLPAYIHPVRPNYSPEDLDFLHRRGALYIPPDAVREELVRCFVVYVYPYMPVVDLQELVDALDGREPAAPISLTVFHAILFAGSAFIDMRHLRDLGFDHRREARATFYRNIKLLYDFDWDLDRIALMQALLIANYWYVSEGDQKDPWHWLGVCVSLATSIGLNQPITVAKQEPATRRLWRRIWWSCVMRDRIMAISMRRPMRIRDEDLHLPMLSRDDFDTAAVHTSLAALQHDRSVTDPAMRTKLAELCVAKNHLLLLIGQILRKLYVLRAFGGSTTEATMLYTPQRTEINESEHSGLQDDLDRWYQNLPESCWMTMVNLEEALDPTDGALLVHRSVLRMLFFVASEALNRPLTIAKCRSNANLEHRSTSKVKEAGDQMSDVVQHLDNRDLVRFLPPLSVSFMILAVAAFLVEIKTTGKALGDLPGQQFHRCVRALLQLRDIWPIADSACHLVGQMITRSNAANQSLASSNPTPMTLQLISDLARHPEDSTTGESSKTSSHASSRDQTPPPPAGRDPPPYQAHAIHPAMMSIDPATVSALDSIVAPPADVDPKSVAPLPNIDPSWTTDFDYSMVAHGHALHMDLALAEIYGLDADFDNSFLGFDPTGTGLGEDIDIGHFSYDDHKASGLVDDGSAAWPGAPGSFDAPYRL